MNRGPTLDLYLACSVKTRLSIGARDRVGLAVAGALNRQPIHIEDPELQRLSFFAPDETWTRSLLEDTVARKTILRLTADNGPFELRQIHFQPEAVMLRLFHTHTSTITAANVRAWTDDLSALARVAEALPPPRQAAEATPLERNSRVNRGAFILPAFGIVFGLLCVLSACALVSVAWLLLAEAR